VTGNRSYVVVFSCAAMIRAEFFPVPDALQFTGSLPRPPAGPSSGACLKSGVSQALPCSSWRGSTSGSPPGNWASTSWHFHGTRCWLRRARGCIISMSLMAAGHTAPPSFIRGGCGGKQNRLRCRRRAPKSRGFLFSYHKRDSYPLLARIEQ